MLAEEFTKIMDAAKALFGNRAVTDKVSVLEMSYSVGKNAWERNLKRIEGIPIKYLLICEAPPAPKNGHVSYFYETFDNSEHGRPVGWIRSILFKLNGRQPVQSIENCLNSIASSQMLLVDSLPVAWQYSSNIRKKPGYRNLVAQSSDYLMGMANHPDIAWAENVQVALGFKLNAMTLIDVYKNGVKLPNGQTLRFSASQIITDGSGYPSAEKLKILWGL